MNRLGTVGRIYVVVLCLFVVHGKALAQNRDSLFNVLNEGAVSPSQKADILLRIANTYINQRTDSVGYFATQALNISEQEKYQQGIALSYDMLGTYYSDYSKRDSAIYYFKEGIELSRKYKLDKYSGDIYNNLGGLYLKSAENEVALNYFDTALRNALKYNNYVLQAKVQTNIASIYYSMSMYSKALEHYLYGLDMYERINNNDGKGMLYLNLANVYFRLEDFNNAIAFADSSIALATRVNSDWSKISAYTTYAMVYDKQEKYDSALVSLTAALELSEKVKNPFFSNLLRENIAECFVHMGQIDTAHKMYDAALDKSIEIHDNEGVYVAYKGLGDVLDAKGQKQQALNYYNKALNYALEIGDREGIIEITKTLSELYEDKGDYKRALAYHKEYSMHSDSLAKDQSLDKVRQLHFNYELQKKQDQIENLEQVSLDEKGRIERQKILLIASVIGLLLTLIIAYLIFRNLRNEQRRKDLIVKQKEEIEQKTEKLEELNAFKDRTFSVLSHDLRSPINALTSTMELFDQDLLTPEEFNEHKEELSHKLESVSLLMDNLLQWAKSQMKGEHTLDIEKLSIKRKTLKAFAVLKDTAGQKGVTLVNKVSDDAHAYGDKNQIEMVMRNLVSNAIKFTPDGGSVTVSAKDAGDRVAISVQDTGVGMSQDQQERLFKGETNVSTRGTKGEKGTGVGLYLSYNFVKANEGELKVESIEGKGTTFTVYLPKEFNA